MRKILIGTHNKGKFNEIANLITKKIKKISPIMLKIPSPKEREILFFKLKIKSKFFQNLLNIQLYQMTQGLR